MTGATRRHAPLRNATLRVAAQRNVTSLTPANSPDTVNLWTSTDSRDARRIFERDGRPCIAVDVSDMIAALYVAPKGVYYGLPNVIEPWGLPEKDARDYAGPWPVVAHPPCERWGDFWAGSPLVIARGGARKIKGDDGGCFAAALAAVRKWGGVLEHPADSYAWEHFGLARPPKDGHWVNADFQGGWICHVEQGHYGHPGRKPTWLYVIAPDVPPLLRGKSAAKSIWPISKARQAARGIKVDMFMPHKARAATPIPFRDLLISIAEIASPRNATHRL